MNTATWIEKGTTVAEIVLEHPECAKVFQDHRVDFCCRGGMSLGEACSAKGLDPAALGAALERAVEQKAGAGGDLNFRAMPLPELVAYIVRRHHGYLRGAMGPVGAMAAKVARVHGEHNPRLVELDVAYRALVAALTPHLDEEERELFPAMLTGAPDRAKLERELGGMKAEHLAVGALLERIRTAAEDFQVPDWGCNTYRALFAELESLEGDVLRHVHLENHVLAPRALG
jgi:regulator of cell morphogenesis and NO signaling